MCVLLIWVLTQLLVKFCAFPGTQLGTLPWWPESLLLWTLLPKKPGGPGSHLSAVPPVRDQTRGMRPESEESRHTLAGNLEEVSHQTGAGSVSW